MTALPGSIRCIRAIRGSCSSHRRRARATLLPRLRRPSPIPPRPPAGGAPRPRRPSPSADDARGRHRLPGVPLRVLGRVEEHADDVDGSGPRPTLSRPSVSVGVGRADLRECGASIARSTVAEQAAPSHGASSTRDSAASAASCAALSASPRAYVASRSAPARCTRVGASGAAGPRTQPRVGERRQRAAHLLQALEQRVGGGLQQRRDIGQGPAKPDLGFAHAEGGDGRARGRGVSGTPRLVARLVHSDEPARRAAPVGHRAPPYGTSRRGGNAMRRMMLAAAAAILTTACVRTAVDPVTGRMDVDVESPPQQGQQWRTEIAGQGSAASLTGSASARSHRRHRRLRRSTSSRSHPRRAHPVAHPPGELRLRRPGLRRAGAYP